MNFLDIIVLFAEITSEIHETALVKQGKSIIRNIRIQNNLSFATKIPDFKMDSIIIGDQKVNVGTVIKRPLALPLISKIEYHYGVVLGTTSNGESIIIEMTNNDNVRLANLKQFLKNYNIGDIIIEPYQPNIKLKDIIERAKNFQFESFNLFDLNCKDFAYFCAYQIDPTERSILLKKVQLYGIELAINYRQFQFDTSENNENSKFLMNRINRLKEKKRIIESELRIK
jgi:hypothetical protein